MVNNKVKKALGIIIVVIFLCICILGITVLRLSHKEQQAYTSINTSTNINTNIGNNPNTNNEIKEKIIDNDFTIKQADSIAVVPTMLDVIENDSSWCGAFQLVWNDMKNELVKKDVIFNPQLDVVKNLNKEDFNETMLSEDYYYKKYGRKSLALKEQIEMGIKEKFNQTSDILDKFDWPKEEEDNPKNIEQKVYFFYAMLCRRFEFLQKFDKLDNDKFGDKYEDVEYFGIDSNTDNSIGNQIRVLYYNSKEDFAILINTKTNDEVIFCKDPKGNTFNEIYDNLNEEANSYTGSVSFKAADEFKAPKMDFSVEKDYEELEHKKFEIDGGDAEIDKAIQIIKLSLDENGGDIKSEAAIEVSTNMTAGPINSVKEETRYFYVDDTFAIFLREKGKDKPYFAGKIEDIRKFQ